MNNHEFNEISDEIRELCDGMSPKQVKDLIELLEHDARERKELNDRLDTAKRKTAEVDAIYAEVYRREQEMKG
jgi:uncharacterized coiled-coil DUF342 family protein